MRSPRSWHYFQPHRIPSDQPLHEELNVPAGTGRHWPCIGRDSQFLERPGCGARRIGLEHRALLAHRAAQVLVLRYLACEFEHNIEEARRDALEAAEKLRAAARGANAVCQHPKAPDSVIAIQDLDERVRVG